MINQMHEQQILLHLLLCIFRVIYIISRTSLKITIVLFINKTRALVLLQRMISIFFKGRIAWIFLIKFFACIYSLRNDMYNCMFCFFKK